MHIVLLTIALLGSGFSTVIGQSECLTPNGINGTCIIIEQCNSLLGILNVNITQRDLDYLKGSSCKLEGTTQKVCCPKTCITPASSNGTCASVYSCPSLAKLLESPLSKKNVQHLQNSRCPGTQEDIVCCPPDEPTVAAGICSATASVFPPEPRTECCGVESVVTQATKGARTTIYQYPWLANLEYFRNNITELRASGSLISARYVLTAGHCVTGEDVSTSGPPVSVRLGEYDTTNSHEPDCTRTKDGVTECNDGMIRIQIERSIPHPDFKNVRSRSNHDIALIRLKQNAPFTDFIRPICLPSSDLSATPPADYRFYVAGWGKPNPIEKLSTVKLQVDLPFVDNDQCRLSYIQAFRKYIVFTSGHVCAGGEAGKDTCKGDSGAPLMYQNGKTFEVVGVVSIGATNCGSPIPGIYTKVYEYLPWIRRNINIDLALYADDNDSLICS